MLTGVTVFLKPYTVPNVLFQTDDDIPTGVTVSLKPYKLPNVLHCSRQITFGVTVSLNLTLYIMCCPRERRTFQPA